MKRRGSSPAPDLHGHLAAALQRQSRGCRRGLKRCRRQFAPGEVHALRVRIRRLLALIELPAAFLEGDVAQETRDLLKKKLNLFDDLRDTQVQQQHLKGLLRAYAAARFYRDHLRRREAKAIRKAGRRVKRLKTKRLWRVLDELAEAVVRRGGEERRAADLRAVSLAVRQAHALTARVQSRDRTGRPAAIHRTRITFKKYRYMAEVLAGWFNCPTAEIRRKLRAFQTLMGDIQDAQVLLREARDFARRKRVSRDQSRPFLMVLEDHLHRAIKNYLASRGALLHLAPDRLGLPLFP